MGHLLPLILLSHCLPAIFINSSDAISFEPPRAAIIWSRRDMSLHESPMLGGTCRSQSIHSTILTPIWRPTLTWVLAVLSQAFIIFWFRWFMASHSSDARPPAFPASLTHATELCFSASHQGKATG